MQCVSVCVCACACAWCVVCGVWCVCVCVWCVVCGVWCVVCVCVCGLCGSGERILTECILSRHMDGVAPRVILCYPET